METTSYENNEIKNFTYEGLIESTGIEILVQENSYDYQGDSILLVKDNKSEKHGFLIFGWGSCPMCDALQACNTLEDYKYLRKSLYDSIFWDVNVQESIKHILEKPWELTHLDEELVKRFINSVKKYATTNKIDISVIKHKKKSNSRLVFEDKDDDKESPFAKLQGLF